MRDQRDRLVEQRADALEVSPVKKLVCGAHEVVGVVRALGEVRGKVERFLDVRGGALVELDRGRQGFVHPGLGQLAMILQIPEQCGMHFTAPAYPVQITDELAQFFWIGPVLVVGPVVVGKELVRVDLCPRPGHRARTRVDRDQVGDRWGWCTLARFAVVPARGFVGFTTGSGSAVEGGNDEGPAGCEPGWPWVLELFLELCEPRIASLSCFFFA